LLTEKGGLRVICPPDTGDGIMHFTTTSQGGFSAGDYASFNTALHVGDDCRSVLKNLEKLKYIWNIPRLVTLSQVHGNVIHEVTSDNLHEVMFSEGDGLFTKERGIALGILTADCWNVHLIGRECIASLHCGWRSVAAGIVDKAAEMFRQNGDVIEKAVVGPGISSANYETGQEVADEFARLGFQESVEKIGGKTCLSINTIIIKTLEKYGAGAIINVAYCTYACDFLYSHRRSGGKTGRMISVLMRK
jgi:YfiH family protein